MAIHQFRWSSEEDVVTHLSFFVDSGGPVIDAVIVDTGRAAVDAVTVDT